MTGLAGEIARLYAAPGGPGTAAAKMLRNTADAHRQLLLIALRDVEPRRCPALSLISALLPQNPCVQRRFLCAPVLVEGLHELADASPAIRAWHDSTADPVVRRRDGPADGRPPAGLMLGNAALSAVLRTDPHWCGMLPMRTDHVGLLQFPLSDWSLSWTTTGDSVCLLSEEPVALHLTRGVACFSLGGDGGRPVLSMPRRLLVRLIAHNDPSPDPHGVHALDPALRATWRRAAALCPAGTRFLPVHCARDGPHSARCGAVVRHVHDQLARASPAVHGEFCRLIDTVHGFELPGRPDGVVQSFSEPTRPRLVGFNVPCTDHGAPCGCPFAVTCFGHELAHSKMYLAGSIGWHNGWRLLNNPGDRTGVLPRYGRALGVRTLFQIPYTHLYEWTILIDACGAGLFARSPETDDPLRFGDALRDEIAEAFTAIEDVADLTAHGDVALEHFRRMFHETETRWDRLNGTRPRGALIERPAAS